MHARPEPEPIAKQCEWNILSKHAEHEPPWGDLIARCHTSAMSVAPVGSSIVQVVITSDIISEIS